VLLSTRKYAFAVRTSFLQQECEAAADSQSPFMRLQHSRSSALIVGAVRKHAIAGRPNSAAASRAAANLREPCIN